MPEEPNKLGWSALSLHHTCWGRDQLRVWQGGKDFKSWARLGQGYACDCQKGLRAASISLCLTGSIPQPRIASCLLGSFNSFNSRALTMLALQALPGSEQAGGGMPSAAQKLCAQRWRRP